MENKQKLTEKILESRQARLDFKKKSKIGGGSWFTRNIIGRGLRYLIGLISMPIALATLYGPDDITTLGMAIAGKDPFTWQKLDKTNRLLYAAAALIPVIPSTILIDPLMLIREFIEDAVYARQKGEKFNWNNLPKLIASVWAVRAASKKKR